jgi:hypothetical protein
LYTRIDGAREQTVNLQFIHRIQVSMKKWNAIPVLMMCLVVFAFSAHADHRIEGIWENPGHRILLTIESTGNGIRVKRSDQNRWYHYDEFRDGQFRDRDGNTYYLIDDQTLEWEDRSGRKYLRFQRQHRGRSGNGNPYDNAYRENGDTYIERNHYLDGHAKRDFITAHRLIGRWINPTTGQMIEIRSHKQGIKVRAHRGGWTHFYRRDGNTFLDQKGNRYDFIGGNLVYTSRRGDFRMEFSRH